MIACDEASLGLASDEPLIHPTGSIFSRHKAALMGASKPIRNDWFNLSRMQLLISLCTSNDL